MGKIYFGCIVVLAGLHFFGGCQKKQDIASPIVTIEKNISTWGKKIGVNSIKKFSNESNVMTYVFSADEKNINGIHINVDEAVLKVTSTKELISLDLILKTGVVENNVIPPVSYELRERNKIVYDKIRHVFLDENTLSDKFTELKTFIAMVLYNEVSNPALPQNPREKQISKNFMAEESSRGCERTIVSIRNSKSS